jgi:AcrR family transcriptional regulator
MSRKVHLDKTAVVQAAADLLNREPGTALSLNRLAEQLGVQTPSLYNHVDGLPGLQRELALLNARILGTRLTNAAIGKAGADGLLAVAHAYRDYIKACPGLYMASLRAAGTQTPLDSELQQAEEQIVHVGLAMMASFGLQGEDALHAVRGLRSVVHGFATLEVSGGFGLPLDCDESFARLLSLLIRGLQP